MTTAHRGRPFAGWQRTLGYAVLFAATYVLGRATTVGPAQLALVWPASAVGFLWLLGSWGNPTRRLVDVCVLFAVSVPAQLLTGRSGALALSLAVAGLAQPVLACVVFVRLLPGRCSGAES